MVRSCKTGYIFIVIPGRYIFFMLSTLSSLEYEKNEKLANKHSTLRTTLVIHDRSN